MILTLHFIKNSFGGWQISTKPLISVCIIWNNKNIKIVCKTIYYPHYAEAGFLIYRHMLLDHMHNLQSRYNTRLRKEKV